MEVQQKAQEALKVVEGQINELTGIVGRDARYNDPDVVAEKLRRWKTRTVRLLSDNVHPEEGRRIQAAKPLFPVETPRDLMEMTKMYRAILDVLSDELRDHPEHVLCRPTQAPSGSGPERAQEHADMSTVFIIHGHDDANLLRLEKLLRERWRLEPIILRERSGKSRTLIEKLEQEAQTAEYAFALLTPDDLIEVAEGQYAQTRPNVVFELGWFFGRKGRESACILLKKGTKLHSDLDGINRIEFTDSIEEKILEIERELKEARLIKKA